MISNAYIHIPFCKNICSYCDFCKKKHGVFPINEYINLLDKEIGIYIKERVYLDSLYFGGGTPSILTEKELINLFKTIEKFFILKKDCEVTFECNPEDITVEKILLLKELGVNRISLGVQTMNDAILHELNRSHSSDIVHNALNILNSNMDNVNIDLMYDLPNENINDISSCLQLVDTYTCIKHLSYYSLILEKNTVLGNKNYIVDEDESLKKSNFIRNQLKKSRLQMYEVSNYSQEGYESKHNLNTWNQQMYYGFGLGASGYINNTRYTNTASFNKYKRFVNNNEKPLYLSEDINLYDQKVEKIFLNFRLRKGMSLHQYTELGFKPNKYFKIDNDRIYIKEEYIDISDQIIVDLMMEVKGD